MLFLRFLSVFLLVLSHALPVKASLNSSAECLFDGLEKIFPMFFKPPTESQTWDIYYYRQYTDTKAYLAVTNTSQHLFYLGPLSGGAMMDFGNFSSFLGIAGCPLPVIEQNWQINLGQNVAVPFFPDAYSNYFTYAFSRKPGDDFLIRIEGTFPDVRYLSVTVYDNNTRNPLVHLRDVDLFSESYFQNPFQGNAGYQAGQNYTFFIGPDIIYNSGFVNAISYPDSQTSLSVFMRYYLPRGDNYGSVSLPRITIVDKNGNPRLAPEPIDLPELIQQSNIMASVSSMKLVLFSTEQDSTRRFFRPSANSGMYANPDNEYLVSAVTLGEDDVVLLRWKSPSHATDFTDFTASDMRYYSLSLSDEYSHNYITMADENIRVAADGYINIVIARDDPDVWNKAAGLNIMAWPEAVGNRGVLLYRNLVTQPNFLYPISLCPSIASNILGALLNPGKYEASNFMGAYAPQGKKMSKALFLNDFGGVPVSY